MTDSASQIFQRGSKTYYTSSLFFPKTVRDRVFTLYAFVRTTDDYVDQIPPQTRHYQDFKRQFGQAQKGESVTNQTVAHFSNLVNQTGIKSDWVHAFFASMEMDLTPSPYPDLDSLIKYIYGSAEVIGLMMARILNLPPEADFGARRLGRAMQYLNFLRDIDQDLTLGRQYFPVNSLQKYGLADLTLASAQTHTSAFIQFIHSQINLYRQWQSQAEAAYRFIPRRYLLPIKTAADMHAWTASRIYQDPLVIYRRQLKPSRLRLFNQIFLNFFSLNFTLKPHVVYH